MAQNQIYKVMKALTGLIIGTCLAFTLMSGVNAQSREELLPPFGLEVKDGSNVATWHHPRIVLLQEDFQESSFPPDGWSTSSLGAGWNADLEPQFNLYWAIPYNGTRYAYVNDDKAPESNNGTMDYLISPILDLTVSDSFSLTFESFFNGAFSHDVFVEYRVSEDSAWQLLYKLPAELDWISVNIDLAEFSGEDGISTFQFAFHSDDHNLRGSGCGIDNVLISNSLSSNEPLDYLLFYDDDVFDSTTLLSYVLPYAYYGENHHFAVCARYPSSNSDTVSAYFTNHYLYPPSAFCITDTTSSSVHLDFFGPYHPGACGEWELQFTFNTQNYSTEGGCESDGEYIYVSFSSNNTIEKYTMTGDLIESFNVPGVPGLYDLAYCYWNGCFYGGRGTNKIYVMNFSTHQLVGEIITPVPVIGLTYANDWDGFWISNGSDSLTLIDDDGSYLYSISTQGYDEIHGLADDWTLSGPTVWAFSRDSTGSLLIPFDPWGGAGSPIDISSISSGDGQAAGLFITTDLISNCVVLGGNLSDGFTFGYSLGEEWPQPPPGVVKYYLYDHESLIDSVSSYYSSFGYTYWGEIPTTHEFYVSALYDLAEFGFPEEFVETEKVGPLYFSSLPVVSHVNLDFEEDWSSQSFQTHEWETDGDRWKIINSLGNPSPTLVFAGNPNLGEYDQSVTSTWVNTSISDSCETLLTYDFKLVDTSPTGLQTLALEYFNGSNNSWDPLAIYHNDPGLNYFLSDSFKINRFIRGDAFRFRFRAYGPQSSDVTFWVVDNIRVTRHCVPPQDLSVVLDENSDSVIITWNNFYKGDEKNIHWDDGIPYTSIGFGEPPEMPFEAAVRWDSAGLQDYFGYELTNIGFYLTEPEAFYVFKAWSGDSAENVPTSIVSSEIDLDQWNFFDVDPPIPIDVNESLWIGFHCNSRDGFPVSVDDGPAVDGFGNMLNFGGTWYSLLEIDPGMDFNFNIQAIINRPEREVEAFQVYRSIDGAPFVHFATTLDTVVLDSYTTIDQPVCYRARTVCFNDPGLILVSDFSDTVCIYPVDIPEVNKENSGIHIYPNPTEGVITVQSAEIIERIDICEITGRTILSFGAIENQIKIDLNEFEAGGYVIRILTQKSIITRKITML